MTFHIHVDAEWLTGEFEEFLVNDLGYWRTDFVAPDGGRADPVNHLTLKPKSASEFRKAFKKTIEFAKSHNAMSGYVEGEFIALDKRIEEKIFDPDVKPPFKIEMVSLPPGKFKQSEVHITLCPERSNPILMAALRDMGFMSIYMPKSWGIALIFTAQGNRSHINRIVGLITPFLEKMGGAINCDIKEERIAKWWISDSQLALPRVIKNIVC